MRGRHLALGSAVSTNGLQTDWHDGDPKKLEWDALFHLEQRIDARLGMVNIGTTASRRGQS
jgi:hypothetical protein